MFVSLVVVTIDGGDVQAGGGVRRAGAAGAAPHERYMYVKARTSASVLTFGSLLFSGVSSGVVANISVEWDMYLHA